jgi:hypothetical protein
VVGLYLGGGVVWKECLWSRKGCWMAAGMREEREENI